MCMRERERECVCVVGMDGLDAKSRLGTLQIPKRRGHTGGYYVCERERVCV